MSDKFGQLEQKIDRVLARLDQLRDENQRLEDENNRLQAELLQVRRTAEKLRLEQTDLSDQVKNRLSLVLQRVTELESLSH